MTDLSKIRNINKPYLSRSKMQVYSDNPVAWAVGEYLTKSSSGSKFSSKSEEIGKEVHEAIENALKHLQERVKSGEKIETKDFKKLITEATNEARSRMVLQNTGRISSQHFEFAQDAINKYGKLILEGNDDFLIEEQMEAFTKSDKTRFSIGGRPDLVQFNKEKNAVSIIDWKDWGDFKFTDFNSVDKLRNEYLTKVYSLVMSDGEVLKTHGLNPAAVRKNGIKVIFEINAKALKSNAHVFSKSKDVNIDKNLATVTLNISERDITNFETQIKYGTDTLYNDRLKLDNLITNEGETGISKWISDQIKAGKCDSTLRTCKLCPARFICPRSKVTVDKIQSNMKASKASAEDKSKVSFGKADESILDREVDITKEEYVNSLTQRRDANIRKYTQDIYNKYQIPEGADTNKAHEISNIRKEYIQAYTDAHMLDDITKKNAFTAKSIANVGAEKLELSFLDENLSMGFYDYKFQRTLKNLSYKHLNDTFEELGYDKGSVFSRSIVDEMGFNKKLNEDINSIVSTKISDIASKEQIDIDQVENIVKDGLSNHKKIINNDMITRVQKHLNSEAVKITYKYNREALENKVGKDKLHKLIGSQDISKIADNVLTKTDTTGWINSLNTGRSFKSLLEKYSLKSRSKFPLTGAIAAYFLSYFTGVTQSNTRAYNTAQKYQEHMSREEEVSTGDHYSAISMSQRLSSSDFGSGANVKTVSNFISKIMPNKDRILKKVKDNINRTIAKNSKRLDTSKSDKLVNNFFDNENKIFASLAALTGFSTVVLPRLNINNPKRRYENRDPETLRIYDKSSEQRQRTKLNTPFGSPLTKSLFKFFKSVKPDDVLELTKTFGKESRGGLFTKYLKSDPIKKSTKISRRLLNRPKDIIKSAISKGRHELDPVYVKQKSRGNIKVAQKKLATKELVSSLKNKTQYPEEFQSRVARSSVRIPIRNNVKTNYISTTKSINKKDIVEPLVSGNKNFKNISNFLDLGLDNKPNTRTLNVMGHLESYKPKPPLANLSKFPLTSKYKFKTGTGNEKIVFSEVNYNQLWYHSKGNRSGRPYTTNETFGVPRSFTNIF